MRQRREFCFCKRAPKRAQLRHFPQKQPSSSPTSPFTIISKQPKLEGKDFFISTFLLFCSLLSCSPRGAMNLNTSLPPPLLVPPSPLLSSERAMGLHLSLTLIAPSTKLDANCSCKGEEEVGEILILFSLSPQSSILLRR